MPDQAQTRNMSARKRDPRLDFFRGLALVMIFINHIPGQFYENLTSRNIGFSDAAEGFVFMSGAATAIAYGPRLSSGLNWSTLQKIWGRAWQLYLVHIFITACALAIMAFGILFLDANLLLIKNGMGTLLKTPLEFLLGTVMLTNQMSYVNILPLYSVLMLAAPFTILLAQRKPLVALALGVAIWAIAGYFKLSFPTYPNSGGWFLNPFSWQLIFLIGILTGLALRAEKRLVPVNLPLILATTAYLVFAAIDLNSPALQKIVGQSVVFLIASGVPAFLVDFIKPFVGGPRLLHLLALVYMLSMPWLVPQIAASRYTAPIRLMGRHSLPVFALGTVLSFAGQTFKTAYEATFLQDTAIIGGGLLVLFTFAWSREWLAGKARKTQNAAPSHERAFDAESRNPAENGLVPFAAKLAS